MPFDPERYTHPKAYKNGCLTFLHVFFKQQSLVWRKLRSQWRIMTPWKQTNRAWFARKPPLFHPSLSSFFFFFLYTVKSMFRTSTCARERPKNNSDRSLRFFLVYKMLNALLWKHSWTKDQASETLRWGQQTDGRTLETDTKQPVPTNFSDDKNRALRFAIFPLFSLSFFFFASRLSINRERNVLRPTFVSNVSHGCYKGEFCTMPLETVSKSEQRIRIIARTLPLPERANEIYEQTGYGGSSSFSGNKRDEQVDVPVPDMVVCWHNVYRKWKRLS